MLTLLFVERPAYSLDHGPYTPKQMVHCTSSQGQQGLVQGQQGQDGGRVRSLVPHQVKNLQQGPLDQVKASSSAPPSTWASSLDVWNFTVVANWLDVLRVSQGPRSKHGGNSLGEHLASHSLGYERVIRWDLPDHWNLRTSCERGNVEGVFPTRVTPRKSPRSLFTLLTALTNMRSWRMLVSSSKMAAILIGLGTKSPPGNASTRQKRQIEQIIADSRILQPKQKFIWIALKRSFAVKWQLKRHIFTENRKGKGHNCRETLDNRQITPRNPQPLLIRTRVAGLGRLSVGAKMAIKPFVKRVVTIFATNASFLRVISIFRI